MQDLSAWMDENWLKRTFARELPCSASMVLAETYLVVKMENSIARGLILYRTYSNSSARQLQGHPS